MCTMISTFRGIRTRLEFTVPSRLRLEWNNEFLTCSTPLNVVYHCPNPFRWAFFCPSLHPMQQRTNFLLCIISKFWLPFLQFVSSLQALAACKILENLETNHAEKTATRGREELDLPLPNALNQRLTHHLLQRLNTSRQNFWNSPVKL